MRARYQLRAVVAILGLCAAPCAGFGKATESVLLSETVTTAVSGTTTTAVVPSHAVGGATLLVKFDYGSGGTTAQYWVQTTFDEGTTWVDVCTFAFATSDLNKITNLTTVTPITTLYTPTDATLADNTCKDGVLGSQYRVKRTTVGTYAGSTTIIIKAILRE